MNHIIIEKITQRAAQADKCVVLPEGNDGRILHAAQEITSRKYAKVILLSDENQVRSKAKELGVDLAGVEVINHLTDEKRDEYVDMLYQRRREKGMSRDDAEKLLARCIYYGGMMVGAGRADGMVAGSAHPTSDTVRSAMYCVGTAPGCRTVSSCSLMNTAVPEVGVDGMLIFADTGVVPEPSVEQLADIAIAAADACRTLLEIEPVVAMLSFSTKGSARSPAVQKVVAATEQVRQRRPDLMIDGELQLDSAIMPEVARRKAKLSAVAGRANTLIFPDLSSGNIGYKLVERLGGATALGPLLLGLARPVNDLSRGCRASDVILVTAITATQSIAL